MKICLATTEILGAHRNGGIGTATSHLALLLAHGGHDITLLNASSERVEANSLWSSLYKRFGVRIAPLPTEEAKIEPWELRAPAVYFDQLWTADFDVVIFQDWLGLAHACTTAKAAGLAFLDTVLVVNTHGSMAWVHDIADVAPPGRGKLLQAEIERRAIEGADVVISPSQYLVDWMRTQGWRLPSQTHVLQNFLAGFTLAGLDAPRRALGNPRPHLVYFGRLERRKGIFLFLEALLAAPLGDRRFQLSFLGRDADLTAAVVRDWVHEHRPDLSPGLQIHTDKTAEEALSFLREGGGLAVIPSYADNSPCVIWECIEAGVPFISTVNGGIPELVAPDAHERVLVEPQALALATRLAQALDAETWPRVGHAKSPDAVGQAWLSLLEALHERPSAKPHHAKGPPLTVILLDTANELALARRLRELALQTTGDFELVVVSERAPMGGLQPKPVWIAPPGADMLDAIKAAAAVSHGDHLVIASTDGQLSPALTKNLSVACRALPDCILTGQQAEAESGDEAADLFTRPNLRRKAFAGGPLAIGAFDNRFGDLPFAIPSAAMTEDIEWLPQKAAGWALLSAWALAGHRIVSLPIPLSASPPAEDLLHARESRQREQIRVKRLYAQALPPALADLVLCETA